MSLLTSKFGNIGAHSPKRLIIIVECGLYVKGYDGDQLSGDYSSTIANSVGSMRSDMGFTDDRTTLAPKEFKALLTMDSYVLIGNGSAAIRSLIGNGSMAIRSVQQWMNRQYFPQPWFDIIPADGQSSREVEHALVFALQEELDVPGANGNFGSATRAALQARPPLDVGVADSAWSSVVHLFQAAIIFNGYAVVFDGVFSQAVSDRVKNFQRFAGLPVTGKGDYPTWSSLLVSTGDPTRKGTACDTATEITADRATSLRQAGYTYVGRYLIDGSGATASKAIQPGELDTVFRAGMRVFPIYQTTGNSAGYFSDLQGSADAGLALDAATGLGFQRGTTVYFAVDFDALDIDVANHVLPYFRAIKRSMDYWGNPYEIGVYGPRKVGIQLLAEGLTTTSFVADLSSGWNGNVGVPLPRNWAFDQVSTNTTGTDAGAIEVGDDVASGRDQGQSSVTDRRVAANKLDTAFDKTNRDQLLADLTDYTNTKVSSNKTALIHSVEESLNMVITYDPMFTHLGRAYGIRKALAQSEAFWEYWKEIILDWVADLAVEAWYSHQEEYEIWQKFPDGFPPLPLPGSRDDDSTGIGQIFARTAITARNWAVAQKLIHGSHLDDTDWHVMYQVWRNLRDDAFYNIGTIPLVLLEGASEIGVAGIRLDYSADELQRIFARYNGTGSGAEQYGREVYGVYEIFERYNAMSR